MNIFDAQLNILKEIAPPDPGYVQLQESNVESSIFSSPTVIYANKAPPDPNQLQHQVNVLYQLIVIIAPFVTAVYIAPPFVDQHSQNSVDIISNLPDVPRFALMIPPFEFVTPFCYVNLIY
ncbi:MAG: hypothetical protein EZS28_016012 [Streblomastix strix]|uniref:Transmembrane protein n=1 Tax=Streblomastix strix TaxID=222440 RepID=A0A5J4W1E3_9EUKA|nr:MAG: hypothetical protein EZS28_016012 [Streblomastix strix]